MKDYLKELQRYRDREIAVFQNLNLEDVNTVMNVLENARIMRKRIFICGNGGSAATASHYASDFNKGVNLSLLNIDGQATLEMPNSQILAKSAVSFYNFECLSDNISIMTAVSNDESYDEVFRFPLSVKMKAGDVLIGISGSGNSKNVVNAMKYAKENGGATIAIVGYRGGKMKEIADYSIHVDVDDMQISEDIHMVLDHMMMWVLSRSYAKGEE